MTIPLNYSCVTSACLFVIGTFICADKGHDKARLKDETFTNVADMWSDSGYLKGISSVPLSPVPLNTEPLLLEVNILFTFLIERHVNTDLLYELPEDDGTVLN